MRSRASTTERSLLAAARWSISLTGRPRRSSESAAPIISTVAWAFCSSVSWISRAMRSRSLMRTVMRSRSLRCASSAARRPHQRASSRSTIADAAAHSAMNVGDCTKVGATSTSSVVGADCQTPTSLFASTSNR